MTSYLMDRESEGQFWKEVRSSYPCIYSFGPEATRILTRSFQAPNKRALIFTKHFELSVQYQCEPSGPHDTEDTSRGIVAKTS